MGILVICAAAAEMSVWQLGLPGAPLLVTDQSDLQAAYIALATGRDVVALCDEAVLGWKAPEGTHVIADEAVPVALYDRPVFLQADQLTLLGAAAALTARDDAHLRPVPIAAHMGENRNKLRHSQRIEAISALLEDAVSPLARLSFPISDPFTDPVSYGRDDREFVAA